MCASWPPVFLTEPPARCSLSLPVCLHSSLQPLPPQPGLGEEPQKAGLMSIANFTLARTENPVKSWEMGRIQRYQENHFLAVLLKVSYIPAGLWPTPEVLALRRLRQRMGSSRPVCHTKLILFPKCAKITAP